MKMPPESVENQSTHFLTTEENLQVFKLLGNRCHTLSTAVVQLFVTGAPNHDKWIKKGTGVLCFVKDNSMKNYFFRIFSLQRNDMVWEHEMYNNMEYVETDSFFHTFEGEDCIVAFNFLSDREANHFKTVVDQRIAAKRRREDRKSRQTIQKPSPQKPLPQKNLDFNQKQEFRKEKRKRNITKADIGQPHDFVHISHVGWDPNSGFDVNIEDEQMKSLFQKAGVSEKQLRDKETRDFIYNFINTHNRTCESPPPVIPPRVAPKAPSSRPAPPPPPKTTPKARPPSPPKGGPAPPPPPPPPPMDVQPPPPPMPVEVKREEKEVVEVKQQEEEVSDARSDLMDAIRKGIKLKNPSEREIKPVSVSPAAAPGVDLASALRKALDDRSKYIMQSEDDETSSSSNDSDWE